MGENGKVNGYPQARWIPVFFAELRRMARSCRPNMEAACDFAGVSRIYVAKFRREHRGFDMEVSEILLQGRMVEDARNRRRAAAEDDLF